MAPRKKPKKRRAKDKGGQNAEFEDVSDAPLELETQAVSDVLAQSSVKLHIAGLAPSTTSARIPDILGIRQLYNLIKPKAG